MAAPTAVPANETKNCAPKEVDIYRDTSIRYLGEYFETPKFRLILDGNDGEIMFDEMKTIL